jgi:putative nucleotidyltransferase with HDIG domain
MTLTIANKIIENQRYREILEDIENFERDRIFCRHNMEHFLQTARITLIMCREEFPDIPPDFIYSTALLHDIGRAEQYRNGVQHNISGSEIARNILREIGADDEFTERVCHCIMSHRSATDSHSDGFEQIFYMADKKSRNCFCCKAQDECKWQTEKRNMNIEI